MARRSEIAMRQVHAAVAFMEGKLSEFMGHLELGNAEGMERVRVELHALLDTRLDGIQNVCVELRKEMELDRKRS